MKGVIAFFDFDGTVTYKDTLLAFIKYCKGDFSFYTGFILNSPFLIAYKLQLLSNQRAKEIMLRYFFRNMPVGEFNEYCESFSKEKIPSLVRPKALKEIRKLKDGGSEVVIVSASPENWLASWCRSEDVKCIATRLVINNEKISGRIEGLNCHGEEKVRRIREMYDLNKYTSVYGYGDTAGDRPMLSLAQYRFYKPFR